MRLWKRARRPHFQWCQEYSELATYNAEVGHGLVHTPERRARMAAIQERYDQQTRETYPNHIFVTSTRTDGLVVPE